MQQTTAIIIQARMGSTRLPGKIMKELAGNPMLWHVVKRAMKASSADRVIVATTKKPEDDAVEKFCKTHNFLCYRGSAENVLERYHEAAEKFGADIIVRVTADCPLVAPEIIDRCVREFQKSKADYISNVNPGPRTFPRGLDVEVFSSPALERAYRNASQGYEKEHVTPYLWENKKGEFALKNTVLASPDYARDWRLTVDYAQDYILMKAVYDALFAGTEIDTRNALAFLDARPDLLRLNAHIAQKSMQ